jgi:hypothetical protein
MNQDYPDSDCPWSFYFNGEEMPKWTSTWSLIPVEWNDDWIGDLCWRIYCKIDHLGNIESDDANLMQLCVNKHIRALIEKENEVRENISERLTDLEQQDPVYENLFEGLQRMLDLLKGKEVCFWTNGYPADQSRLIEFMKEEHSMYPHQQQRLDQIAFESECEEKALRRIASTSTLPKSIRKALLERKP